MGYYMGDYYNLRGGSSYYRGDPFWGFLGRLAKGAFSAISGFGGSGMQKAASRAETIGRSAGSAVGGVGRMVARHPVLSAAGAAAVLGMGAGAGAEHMMMAGGAACPKGFHPCKSRHGCRHGPCVRNRHMRVTNPRALRRSIRRATGFAKLAMRTIHLVHPKKKARFGGWRKKKK
jgi:hypothetical protein